MLLRPTPLQQPTGPLQLRPHALRTATPWPLGLLDSGTLEPRRQLTRPPGKRIKTGGGRKLPFPGIMQEYRRMLLRPIPLQQPIGPLQLWPSAAREATP